MFGRTYSVTMAPIFEGELVMPESLKPKTELSAASNVFRHVMEWVRLVLLTEYDNVMDITLQNCSTFNPICYMYNIASGCFPIATGDDSLIISKFHNETHDPKGQENKIYTIVKDRETFYRRHTVPITSCSEVRYVLKMVSFGSKECIKELKPGCAYFLGQTS